MRIAVAVVMLAVIRVVVIRLAVAVLRPRHAVEQGLPGTASSATFTVLGSLSRAGVSR